MKNKILVVAIVTLLAMCVLFMPVMAEPTKGQKVTAKSLFVVPPLPEVRSTGEGYLRNGGVFVFKDFVEVYHNNLLFIGDNPLPLTVCAYLVESGSWNSKTGTCVFNSEVVWYISTEDSPDGFAGHESLMLFNYDFFGTHMWASMNVHVVLHGFGHYSGQTLMLSYSGPTSPVTTGYLLKG